MSPSPTSGHGGAERRGHPRCVSLVTVAYFSAPELARLMETFRRECDLAGVTGEVVVVEHSEDAEEHRAVRALDPDRVVVQSNRGYGAGLNRGVEAARGDVLVLSNPDVELLSGSVQALLDALRNGGGVVGPQFTWDRGGRILHPPAEDPAPAAVLRATLARCSQILWRRELSRRVSADLSVWEARQPVTVPSLRGSVLVANRSLWQDLGGFDERFFLYSEETDWLWRARAVGARLEVAPSAMVLHRWAHSTWRLHDRADIERTSRELFERLHYPLAWRWLLAAARRLPERAGLEPIPVSGPDDVPRVEAARYLLSPFRHLAPALSVPGDALDELAPAVSSGRWVLARLACQGSRWDVSAVYEWGS